MYFFSAETGGFYSREIFGDNIPGDAVAITDEEHTALLAGQALGQIIVPAADGRPELQAAPVAVPTAESLCDQVDAAADRARRAVAGDPLRAVEYDRAAAEAQAYASAGYQGEVPPMVAAWAINGRTAQQAADDILREAAQYNGALVQLRATRLQAKAMVRAAMDAGQIEQALDIAAETLAAIEAAVAGIGNNA